LFWPPVVIAVLTAFVAGDIWLFGSHGVAQAMRTGMEHPASFLPLFGAVVLSAALHEIGHAAACRYGGGTPGKMGCGLYLAWPAFYTDVTDAYRLGKKGRLRTDLGGVYLNIIVVLATLGVYFATKNETVLLLVVIQHFEIVHQLLPVVRLDGYYIVADLTGVPDLFARIRPILVSLLPWKKAGEEVTVLKRWVRLAVTAWVLVVVPLLMFQLLMVLIHLPRIVGTALASANKQLHSVQSAFGDGNIVGAVSGILQLIVLALPVIGILLMLATLARRIVQGGWQRTQGRPLARALFLAALAGFSSLLLMAWLPKANYRAIKPGERGTFGEGISAVQHLPSGDGPLESERRAVVANRLATDPNTNPTDKAKAGAHDSTSTPTPTTAANDATTATTSPAGADNTTATTQHTTATTQRTTATRPRRPQPRPRFPEDEHDDTHH
jgi:putative peptide zinc metalloprotease protein